MIKGKVFSQCPAFPDGFPTLTAKVNACAGNVQVSVPLTPFGVTLLNSSMQITLPTGVQWAGLVSPLTATVTGGGSNYTLTNLGTISPSTPVNIKFNITADYSAASQPNILYTLNYNTLVAGISTPGSCSDDGNPLTIDKPQLNLTSVTPQNAVLLVSGGTITRTLKFCNDGLGSVNSAIYINDNHTTDYVIQSVSVNGIPATLSPDNKTITLTSANYGSDGILTKSECLNVIETIKVTGCGNSNGGLTAVVNGYIDGCNNTPDIISNSISTTISMGGTPPNIVVNSAKYGLDTTCMTTQRQQIYTVTNTGQDTARNLIFDLISNGAVKYVPNSLVVTINGNPVTISQIGTLSFAGTTNAASCLGSGANNSGSWALPSLAAGKTMEIKYYLTSCCNAPTCQNFVASSAPQLRYNRLCGSGTAIVTPLQGFDASVVYETPIADYPLTVRGGECFNVEIINNKITIPTATANSVVEYEITVPSGVTPTSYIFQNAENVVVAPLTSSFSGGKLLLTYRYGDIKDMSYSIMNLDFCTTGCPTCVSGTLSFPIIASIKPTATCTGCSGTTIYCGNPVNINLNCPGCSGTCEGIIFRNYDMKRISRCFADSDNDRDPDLMYGSTSLMKLRRAMVGDTVETNFSAYIQTTPTHPTWTYVYAKDVFPTVSGTSTPIYTQVPGDQVYVYRNGSLVCQKTIVASVNTVAGSTEYIRDVSSTVLNCSGISNYINGDSIFVKAKYYVTGNVGNAFQIMTTYPSFYSTLSPSNTVHYGCGGWDNTFTIAGYTQQITGYNSTANTDVTCAGSGPGIRFKSNYGGTSNPFPYEFRNFSIPSEFTITIPSGYDLTKVSAVLNHSGNQSSTLDDILSMASLTTLGNGDKKLTFNLTNLFVNTYPAPVGKFSIPDETYELILTPSYILSTPICLSTEKGVTLTGKFENNCVVEIIAPFSSSIVDNLNNLKFKTPILSANIAGTTVYKTENEECFEFMPIFEDSPGTQYFFHIQPNPNIQVSKVYVNNVLATPLATDPTLYYTGTQTTYKICVTYSGCDNPDTLRVDFGYQCSTTPPANYAAVVCPTIPIKLALLPTPLPASLQISPTPLSYVPELCEPIDFSVIVKNSGVSWLYDPSFKIVLPPYLDVVLGSSKLSWKGINDISIPDPIITSNTATFNPNDYILNYNLQTLGGVLDSLKYGLPGSSSDLPTSYREYELSYKVIAKCGFKANTGATYTATFKDACELPLKKNAFASKIPINVQNNFVANVNITGTLDVVPSCGTPAPVSLALTNTGPGLTSTSDSIYVTMPNTIYIVPNSITNIQNVTSATPQKAFSPPSDTIYRWKVNPNVGLGVNIGLDFNILAATATACGLQDTFNIEMISWRNATCTLSNSNCALPVSSGSLDASFTVKKPTLAFVANTLTNFVSAANTSIISVAVKNVGDIAAQEKLGAKIKIYYDADNSGTVTSGDVLLDDGMFIPGLAVGETKYYYKKFNTLVTQCPIVAELGGGCICGTSVQALNGCNVKPYCNPSPNYTLPAAICEGSAANFSAISTDTLYYNYKWVVYGANVINGTNTTTNPTILNGPGTFNIQWNTAGSYFVKLYSELKVFPACTDSLIQTMTVNAIPSMNQPVNLEIECENQLIDVTDFVASPSTLTTFSWTNNNTAIGLSAGGSGQIANFTAPNNTGTTDRLSTIVVTPSRLGCIGTSKTFTITQKPTPLINTPTDVVVCPNTSIDPVDFVSTPNTASFSWTNSNTNIGLAASGNGQIVPFTSAVNNSSADYVSTIVGKATFPLSALGNVCTSQRTFYITDRATPILTQPVDISKCPGETVPATTFVSSPNTSVTYAWTNTNTAVGLAATGTGNIASYITPTNNTIADYVATVTVTPTRLTCVGPQKSFTITIKPTPVISQPANINVCPGDNINVDDFTSSLSGTTYMWTNTNTAIGLAASGTDQIADFTATNTTTVTQTATIAVTGTAPNGCKQTKSFTITVKPKPTVANATTAMFCPASSSNITLTSTPSGSTFTWTNSNTAIGLATNGSGNISFTSVNSGNTNVTSNLDVTPTLNGCVGNPTTIVITIKPKPIINALSSIVVCPGESIDATDFTSNPTGSTFTWANTNPSIGLSGSGTGQIATFNAAANATAANIIGTFSATPTLNGCAGDAGTFTVTVKPTPTVNAINNVIVCPAQVVNTDDFTSTPSGSTFTWTNDNSATGLTSLSGSGSIADFTSSSNTSGANVISTINVTATLNSCVSTVRSFTVTVRPTPILTATPDISICGGNLVHIPSFATTPTGSTYSWTNTNTGIGIVGSGTGQITDYTAPTNFTLSPIVGTIAVTPTLNTCIGAADNYDVTILPKPTLNQPTDITVCKDETINVDDFVSNTVGSTFSWTNSNTNIGLAAAGTGQIADFTALNSTTSTLTSSLTVVVTAPNGCIFSKTFSIYVKPKPTISGFTNLSKCPNESVNIQFGSNISGTTYSWSNNDTSIGLAASGSGNIVFTTQNTSNAVKIATITVTPTTNGCAEQPQQFTITVKPKPILANLENIIVCPGESINPTDFVSNPVGATYTWTNTNTQIGVGVFGNGDISTYNAPNNISGNNYLGQIDVTPSLNACTGDVKSFTITVKPKPTINQGADVIVCPGQTIDATDFVSNVAGVTYSWTNDNTNIGLAVNGAGQIANFVAVPNTSNTNLIANINATANANGCVSSNNTFSIVLKPTPTMNKLADISVCYGENIDVDNFVSTPLGGSFTWVNNKTNVGLGASGSGQIGTYAAPNNLTGVNQIGNVIVTPTLNGCIGTSQNFNITVKPTPALSTVSDIIVCPSESIDVPDFISTPIGGTFDWTNSNSNIGLSNAGIGQIATFTAPANATSSNISSIITVSTTLDGCQSLSQQFAIKIKPTPTLNNPLPLSVCAGETIDLDDFVSMPTGASFTWSNDNTAIGISTSGNGQIATYNAPDNNTNVEQKGNISFQGNLNGCLSLIQNTSITIKPTPILNSIPDIIVCPSESINPTDFIVTPNNSIISWTNNNTNIGLATPGMGQINTYDAPTNSSLTDQIGTVTFNALLNGCMSLTHDFKIDVKPTPIMNDLADIQVCPGQTINIADFESTPLNASFIWTNSNTAINLAANGNGQIADFNAPMSNLSGSNLMSNLQITPTLAGCVGIPQDAVLTVLFTPQVNSTSDVIVCPGEQININFTGTSGTTFSWTNSNTAIGLPSTGSGAIAAYAAPANNTGSDIVSTLTVQPSANSCIGGTETFMIHIKPIPTVDAIGDVTVCPDETVNFNFTGTPSTPTFNWTNTNPENINIGLAQNGNGNISFTSSSNSTSSNITSLISVTPVLKGCYGNAKTAFVNIKPTPTINQPNDITVCPAETINVDDFSSNLSNVTFEWTNDNTSIGLAASGTGQIPNFVAATNNTLTNNVATISIKAIHEGCESIVNTFKIEIKPTPTMSIPNNIVVCPQEVIDIDNFISSLDGATYAWTNDNTAIGLDASGVGNIYAYNAPQNLTGQNIQANFTVQSTYNACVSEIQHFYINIRPTPIIVSPLDIYVCPGESIHVNDFMSSPTGATYNWTNDNTQTNLAAIGVGNIADFVASPNGMSAVDYVSNIAVIPTLKGCVGEADTFKIVIKFTPNVGTPTNIIVCPGEPINVDFIGTSSSTFTWTNDNTNIGLPSSGVGNINTFNAPANNTLLEEVAHLAVTPTSAGNCVGGTQMFTISIKPTPTVNQPTDVTICPDQNVEVLFGGSHSNTTYNWQNTNTNIGLSSSGNTDISFITNANNTNAIISSSLSVTPSLNGCMGETKLWQINVKPTPSVNQPSLVRVCPGELINVDDFVSTPSGASFNWVNDNPTIGLPATGNGQITSYSAPANSSIMDNEARLQVIPTLNACVGIAVPFDIKIKPTPTMSKPQDIVVCPGTLIEVNDFMSIPSPADYQWTNDNTIIGLASSGIGAINSFLTPAENLSGIDYVSNIHITPTVEGCVGVPSDFKITIKGTPTLFEPNNIVVCPNEPIDVDFIGTLNSTFSWTNSNTAIGLPSSGIDDITTYLAPANTTGDTIKALITVTPTSAGCIGGNQLFNIFIKPTPTVSVPNDTSYCAMDSIRLYFKGSINNTNFYWHNDNLDSGIKACGLGAIVDQAAMNMTGANILSQITVKPELNQCFGTEKTFNVNVKPTPKTNQPKNLIVCSGSVSDVDMFTGTPSGGVFEWASNNPELGLASTGIGQINTFYAPINHTLDTIKSYITWKQILDGCPSEIDTFCISVKPFVGISNISNIVVCPGDSVKLEKFMGNLTGTTYSWSNNNQSIGLSDTGNGDIPYFIAKNMGTLDNVAKLTITPNANDCDGKPLEIEITVLPKPIIDTISNIYVCAGEQISFNFTNNIQPATFEWTNDNTQIGIPSSGSGAILPFTVPANNTGSAISSTLIWKSTTNTCLSNPDTFNIVIKPTPTINQVSNIVVCPIELIDPNDFVASPQSPSISWTNDNTNIGLVSVGNGQITPFNAAINNSSTNLLANIKVQSILDNCKSEVKGFTIEIKPTPQINASNDIIVCPDEKVDFDSIISNVASNFTWNNDNINIGLNANGVGQIPIFNSAQNTTGSNIIAKIWVTPTAQNCVGLTDTFSLTIKPTPFVNKPAYINVCPKETINLDFTGSNGASYYWENSNVAIGLNTNGTGNIQSFFAPENTTQSNIVAKITVHPELNGCIGDTVSALIAVKPTPTALKINDIQLCSLQDSIRLNFGSNLTNTAFDWKNSNTNIGINANGTGNIVFKTPENVSDTIITAIISYKPITDGCVGSELSTNIKVNPKVFVNVISDIVVCSGEVVQVPTFVSKPSGATFTWTNSNASIGLTSNGIGQISNFIAQAVDTVRKAKISISAVLDNCDSELVTFNITVKPRPVMNAPLDLVVCPGEEVRMESFTSNLINTIFDWNNDNTGIGLAQFGKDSIIFKAAAVPPTNRVANINITASTEGCAGVGNQFTISERPLVMLDLIKDIQLCMKQQVDIQFIASEPNTIIKWTNDNTNFGLAANGEGDISFYFDPVIDGLGNIIIPQDKRMATITATPFIEGCQGVPITFKIIIDSKSRYCKPVAKVIRK